MQGSNWTIGENHTQWTYMGFSPPGLLCTTAEGSRTPFCQGLAQAQTTAGLVMSEPYVISALLTPLLGSAVDRYMRMCMRVCMPVCMRMCMCVCMRVCMRVSAALPGRGLAAAEPQPTCRV